MNSAPSIKSAAKVERENGIGTFESRHIGPRPAEVKEMLSVMGESSLDAFIDKVLPSSIRMKGSLTLSAFPQALSEAEALKLLRARASENEVYRSYIGMGYYGTITPPVILRNIFENPGWYTQYTPYQPEISQGRLEALLNFQTVVSDLTGLPIANASLLDEGTAAAEAMALAKSIAKEGAEVFAVDEGCHPQTIEVVQTRARALGIEVKIGDLSSGGIDTSVFGVLVSYPDTYGAVKNPKGIIDAAHGVGALVILVADLMALTYLESPGTLGADIAVGNTQRFGVPLGFGGPHAAFFATTEQFKRQIPGRIVGISKDRQGNPALRLALQTREQHIRREKATSNICTAQVLLAIIAGMFAVYHGPDGLKKIAANIHEKAKAIARALKARGASVNTEDFFDTVTFSLSASEISELLKRAEAQKINVRPISETTVSIAVDEAVDLKDLHDIAVVLGVPSLPLDAAPQLKAPSGLQRKGEYLTHEVFHSYHSETEMLRYMKRLEGRDLSLVTSMIPLGSCTMKLNATSEMIGVSWPEFNSIHPFAPSEQSTGYRKLFNELERSLAEITGFDAVSLQPNAGSQGEYAGLLVIRAYHESRGEAHRDVCLIPRSAHGTNPASAVMAGLKVVVVECDADGNVDVEDLRKKVDAYRDTLSNLMITYPSTHGVFEERVREITELVHGAGGQVYMDGANLNAMVGLCQLQEIGMDVCHINLHKTFCIPHGGGGPGMGPIAVASHLTPFLPNHGLSSLSHAQGITAVSAAPWGSASILPISWMYIAMMGGEELTYATKVAILNANYVAHRLKSDFPVLYRGAKGYVAHECIIDLRPLKKEAGVEVDDVAKRLMDYNLHAPTVSWPVAGTMMVEPTESESKRELDRFCDAMLSIREEIREIGAGTADRDNNLLKNAPHTASEVVADEWTKPYSRERAAFPSPSTKMSKFWPSVARIDASYGDRNLVCACQPMEAYE